MKKPIIQVLCLAVVFALGGCEKGSLFGLGGQDSNLDPINPNDHTNNTDQVDSCQFRTQTMGGWGSKPHGNNPGAYLAANFALAFPNGLTVGCDYTLTLTNSQAVSDFLPQGGPSTALNANYTDVTDGLGNLCGQLVAATISVTMDDYDANFSQSPNRLGDATIIGGALDGLTVDEVLAEANKILGGCQSDYTLSDVHAALTSINENYVDGKKNNGDLNCPGGGGSDDPDDPGDIYS
ncbi:MAG: hypothetical protein KDD36_03910 [Flavobacteriales bacterium]|nr:hypothetical protein [Flavobacteriales bacterium]